MTLVQTMIAADRILQISDRRLTRPDGSVFDDSYNKAVSLCGEYTFAFTGLAFIDRRQLLATSDWLVKQLAHVRGGGDLSDAVEFIRTAAEHAISLLPRSWPEKRLSIVMTGFGDVSSGPGPSRQPLYVRISNFERGKTALPSAAPNFVAEKGRYGFTKNRYFHFSVGAHIEPTERRILRNRLNSCSKRGDWNASMRAMIAIQRLVAARNGSVGADSMVVSAPQRNAAPGVFMTDMDSANVVSETPMFSYVAAKGFSQIRHGPHFVCDGAVISNFRGYAGERPDGF